MYKAIFCDMDNTLLDSKKEISKENIEAIKYAESKGTKFLLCTGRLPFCTKMYWDVLSIKDAITTNGCLVLKDSEYIYDAPLELYEAQALLEFGIKHDEYERLFLKDFLYLVNIEYADAEGLFYKESKCVDNDKAREIINENKIYKIAFLGEHSHLLELKNEIEKLSLDIEIVFSSDRLLECLKKGQSKSNGIIEYCKRSGIDIKDTIGIGDGENDLEMLKTVGTSACPNNAIDEVKRISDYVSEKDLDNSAVSDIIHKYIK